MPGVKKMLYRQTMQGQNIKRKHCMFEPQPLNGILANYDDLDEMLGIHQCLHYLL